MSRQLRKFLLLVGLICLLLGGYQVWRAMHPPLSDQEQIAANLEAMRNAAEQRQAKGVTGYLAQGFTWSGLRRSEFNSQMVLSFTQWRDVKISLSAVNIEVQGDSATTAGNYTASLRLSPSAPPSTASGQFKLYWERQEGEWKVTKAEGGDTLPQ